MMTHFQWYLDLRILSAHQLKTHKKNKTKQNFVRVNYFAFNLRHEIASTRMLNQLSPIPVCVGGGGGGGGD